MSALGLRHRLRMWRWRWIWHRREMASWPTPPNEYQLQRFWTALGKQTREERQHLPESHEAAIPQREGGA
jgi:hypothetical protein